MKSWTRKRVLITVKTYPVPARQGVEVSCTAGVTEERRWVRLFPVPFRLLEGEQQFNKYDWIDVDLQKASDQRPESFKLNANTIHIGTSVPPTDGWRARWEVLKPLVADSMCALQRERNQNGYPTLGLVRPRRIDGLDIEAVDTPDWTPKELEILSQSDLFGERSARLEKLPFRFGYRFLCADPACHGHNMKCTDWEIAQAYRSWRRTYKEDWENKFRARFEEDMRSKYDTHFFVGTVRNHPDAWIIVGLFYPPIKLIEDLFG